MNKQIREIQDWPAFAREHNYSSVAIAKACGAGRQYLARFIQKKFGQRQKHWMDHLRIQHVLAALSAGETITTARIQAGYKDERSFRRIFKKHAGKAAGHFKKITEQQVRRDDLRRIQDWPAIARSCKWNPTIFIARLGVPHRTLHAFFKRKSRVNIKTWLRHHRLRHAAKLIRKGKTLKQVRRAVGSYSATAFRAAFKKRFGLTPAQYKRKTRPSQPRRV